ncbi:NAD(P)-binding domain-containing protein [Nitrospira sp. Nam74]
MQLGMIGLGRMGRNMVRRLMRHKHACLMYDLQCRAVDERVQDGTLGGMSLVGRTEMNGAAEQSQLPGS